MHLQRVIFAINVMLRWSVHVELNKAELGACESGGAVGDNFDSSAQILELDLFYFWDINDGLFCYCRDSGI